MKNDVEWDGKIYKYDEFKQMVIGDDMKIVEERISATIVSTNKGYEHNCPYCGYKWFGRKEHIRTCSRCKRRLDYVGNTDNYYKRENTAINYIAVRLCALGVNPNNALKEAKHRLESILVV